jgi:cell shape-determining protein MreC
MRLMPKNALLACVREILVALFFLNRKFLCYKMLNSVNSSVKYLENRINCIEHFASIRNTLIEHFALFRLNQFERLTLSKYNTIIRLQPNS